MIKHPLKTAIEKQIELARELGYCRQPLVVSGSVAMGDLQEEFHLIEETRVVAVLPVRYKCPLCSARAELWRIYHEVPPRRAIGFQVRCPSSRPSFPPHRGSSWALCSQLPIPVEPIADSRQAVQAWCVLCAMTNPD